MKKVLIIVGILFVVLAALAGIGIFFLVKAGSSLNDVGQQHLDLIQKGDYDGAYNLTSDEFKSATSLEEYKGFIESSDILKNFTDYKLNNSSMSNDVLTITGSISDKDTTMPIQFVATKVGEDWKIVSIEMSPSGFVTADTNVNFEE